MDGTAFWIMAKSLGELSLLSSTVGKGLCLAAAMFGSVVVVGEVVAKPMSHNLNLMSVNNKAELKRAICMNSGASSKLLIAKMHVLQKQSSVNCKSGVAAIRYREDATDPGHVLVNVDPPAENEQGLDCDGKADIGLHYIGLNCLRANMETTSHQAK